MNSDEGENPPNSTSSEPVAYDGDVTPLPSGSDEDGGGSGFWTSKKFLGAAGGAVGVFVLTAIAIYMFSMRIGVVIGILLLAAYLGATAYFFR